MKLDLDISVYQRRWQAIQKNHEHMRDLIIKLMRDPATEPDASGTSELPCMQIHAKPYMVLLIMENYLRTKT